MGRGIEKREVLRKQIKMKRNTILAVLASGLFACSTTKQATTITPAGLDKQGHRGSRGLMPENTIPAMRKAIDLGVS